MHQQIIKLIKETEPDEVRFITEHHTYNCANFDVLPRACVIVANGNETTHRGMLKRDFVMIGGKLPMLGYDIVTYKRDEWITERTWRRVARQVVRVDESVHEPPF